MRRDEEKWEVLVRTVEGSKFTIASKSKIKTMSDLSQKGENHFRIQWGGNVSGPICISTPGKQYDLFHCGRGGGGYLKRGKTENFS